MHSQMQQQIAGMEERIKDQEGTIETLERQVVQAGIKQKITEASKVIDKELTQTQMEQRLLGSRMKDTVDLAKKELALEKKKISVDKQKK